MKSYILIFIIILGTGATYAHVTIHNVFKMAYHESSWTLDGILKTSILQQELVRSKPALENVNLTDRKFKEAAVEYLQNHLAFKVNEQAILLKIKKVSIGKKQSKFIFELIDMSFDVEKVSIQIDVFAKKEEHLANEIYISKGKKEVHFVLTEALTEVNFDIKKMEFDAPNIGQTALEFDKMLKIVGILLLFIILLMIVSIRVGWLKWE